MHYLLTITARVEADDQEAAEAVLLKGSVPLEAAGAVLSRVTASRVAPPVPEGVEPGRTHYWNPDESGDEWRPKVTQR